ncbi:AMP-binding enzyme [Popillia japonica]|uniref:AMP-binding enzyme n=1 Tax=Popillia japonica TaxID=7064 RepID=A0AAW1LZ35_POPJA
MLVISRTLIRNSCRNTWNVLFMNHRGCSSEKIEEDCLRSTEPPVKIPKMTFVELLITKFGKYSNKVGVECGITQRKYTFDEILLKSANLNKNLRKKLKPQRGDTIAFLLPNMPEIPITVVGALLAALKITTISILYTKDEIKRQLIDSEAKILVTTSVLLPTAVKAIAEAKMNLHIITIKTKNTDTTPSGAIDWSELTNTKSDIPDIEPTALNDTIMMPYSSGTTGVPKGVELTNYVFVSNMTQFHSPDYAISEPATATHQDISLVVLPLFHVYGFACSFFMMTDGVKIVTLPKFKPVDYMNSVKTYRPHTLLLVPPLVMFLSSFPGVKPEYLSSLRTIYCSGAPLGASDEDRMRERIGKPISILQVYGLTETIVIAVMPHSVQGKYPGSMGKPFPNTLLKVIAIDDNAGKHLPPDTTGELLIKGPQVMKCYYNEPEKTRDAFLNGWLRSGDLVTYNKDGMLYIKDARRIFKRMA